MSAYLPPPQPIWARDHAFEARADGDPPDGDLRVLLSGVGVCLGVGSDGAMSDR